MAADPGPVRNGFITSLARPGGNITGLSTQAQDTEIKQLQSLHEAVSTLRRIAVLTNSTSASDKEQVKRIQATARAMNVEVLEYSISGPDQLTAAFTEVSKAGVDAILFSA